MSAQLPTDTQLFTCLSCSIAFLSAEDQRAHYRSDHHRYNMKRRVASLPPISVEVFNQKVLDRKQETAIMSSTKGSSCEVCNKIYTTENAYRSHLQSKRHKDNELKAASRPKTSAEPQESPSETVPSAPEAEIISEQKPLEPEASTSQNMEVEAEEEDDMEKTIEEKIAAARSRLSSTNCLFCPHTTSSLEDNLTHMSLTHSFFIPDAEYLVDIAGLINYLGEKIAVGNVCIFCNDKGREFRSMDAVRRHMVDKGHCKIAYDTEIDRLEVSDYYDFSSSYPDGEAPKKKKSKKSSKAKVEEEWEEVSDEDAEIDEIVDDDASESEDPETDDESDEELPNTQLTYGDTEYELVLPSGARIGHRTMRRYYAQSYPVMPRGNKPEDPNSGAALVRRLLADKNSALVPMKGGFGAYKAGTEVVKARNRGEAREAGRHVKEFRDQKKREDFKTKVAFIHNSQKHFRDPLINLPGCMGQELDILEL